MSSIPETMAAVLLTGHGGFDKLEYREDVTVPQPKMGEVLIQVMAAGINNTDINTRTAWYSKTNEGVTEGDGSTTGAEASGDGTWGGASLRFPRIQGIDVCGRIVAVGSGVDSSRVGERVLVEPCLREPVQWKPFKAHFLGSECDGGFAQYCVAPAIHAHKIECPLTDAELASFPCAYSTAENLLHRMKLAAGETVLVTGASGGVGSAAVTLPDGLTVAALVVVNAVGDVINPVTGQVVAGVRAEDGRGLADARTLLRGGAGRPGRPGENTTIGVVATDAQLTQVQATVMAQMAHDGFARALAPSHTPSDGDAIFALATGRRTVPANLSTIGALAADVMAEASLVLTSRPRP